MDEGLSVSENNGHWIFVLYSGTALATRQSVEAEEGRNRPEKKVKCPKPSSHNIRGDITKDPEDIMKTRNTVLSSERSLVSSRC